ncbi:MAG: SET domain-containing protein [Alphaproteobacteria bacterium]
MMLVPNYISQSPIHGIGIFAKEFIAKNTLLYAFDERVDRNYTFEEYNALPEVMKDYCKTYGYFCPVAGCYQLEVDNGRFTNHSFTPNTYFSPCLRYMYAKYDIMKNEEITSDYREFDAKWPDYAHLFGSDPVTMRHICAA